MELAKAREIIKILADGVDPTTGEVLPAESVYNSPEVIRSLFAVLEATAPQLKSNPHCNAGNPWTNIEDAQLVEEIKTMEDLNGKQTANTISSTYAEVAEGYGATVTGVDQVGYIVALVGEAGFDTLQEAVEQAKAGETITLDAAFGAHDVTNRMGGAYPLSQQHYTVYFTDYTPVERVIKIRANRKDRHLV